MNGIEQLRNYCNKLPFSTALQNKITVEVSASMFEKMLADSRIARDERIETITVSKLHRYLGLYDFVKALPEDMDDKFNSRSRGVALLHRIFGDRELTTDEKNCYTVLLCAIEDRYEKYDGSGYPRGRRKSEISPLSQILVMAEQIAGDRLACVCEAGILDALDKKSGAEFSPTLVEIAKSAVAELFDADRKWFGLYGTAGEDALVLMEYQPIFDCEADTVFAYENRMVLRDKNLDPMLPAVYVPVAEKSNRIITLTELQLEKICLRFSLSRLDPDFVIHPVWVNVSAVCLKRKSFTASVKRIFSKYHISPSMIVIEITESALGYGDPQIPASISALREMGVQVALDGFGKEYSSLSILGEIEIDHIKLDSSFSETVCDNAKTCEIVRSILQLAQKLNVNTLMTGINDIKQKDKMIELSCRYMQGDAIGSWDIL